MDQLQRARSVISERANKAASQSRRAGAPVLSANSSLDVLTSWLQWNDPNGSHTDELAEAEGIEPYDIDGAWDALEDMLRDVE